jgi:hypothetical protein
MPASLAKTALFTPKSFVGEFVVAIYYNGLWKENRLQDTLQEAEETARDVHQRTGFVAQVRSFDGVVLRQFGYPISEADCDDAWEDEE